MRAEDQKNIERMAKVEELLTLLNGDTLVEFNTVLNLSEVGKIYLVYKITVEAGNHIIGHFDGGKLLSINNCAVWQIERVITSLKRIVKE